MKRSGPQIAGPLGQHEPRPDIGMTERATNGSSVRLPISLTVRSIALLLSARPGLLPFGLPTGAGSPDRTWSSPGQSRRWWTLGPVNEGVMAFDRVDRAASVRRKSRTVQPAVHVDGVCHGRVMSGQAFAVL